MSERNGFAPGVPCWVDTWQDDADAGVAFYTELFGWEAAGGPARNGDPRHIMFRLRERTVGALGSPRPEAAPEAPAWGTYIQVESANETAAACVVAGGRVVAEPFDSLDGGRMAIVADPAGAVFGVWQLGAHRGAEIVNEPGAWAMSWYMSPDPQAASPFYAEVFGWEADPIDMGGLEVTLYRLPGFVGGEPQQPVPRDLVAVMLPEDGQAQWIVDFWVKDADASAADVVRLGGAIVTGPYDTPTGRQAVVADPAGAVFTVTTVPAAHGT